MSGTNSNSGSPAARRRRARRTDPPGSAHTAAQLGEPVRPRLRRLALQVGLGREQFVGERHHDPRRTPATVIASTSSAPAASSSEQVAVCRAAADDHQPHVALGGAKHGAPRVVVDVARTPPGRPARPAPAARPAHPTRGRACRPGWRSPSRPDRRRSTRHRAHARSTSPRSSAHRARCACPTASSPIRGTRAARQTRAASTSVVPP